MKRALLLLGLAGACAAPRAERPHAPPRPADLLAALRDRSARIRSIRAEARIDHRGEAGRLRATILLIAERPGRLRLDALSPFGSPVASLATDGETVGYLDRDGGRFVRGPARACTLAWLVRLPLGPEQAVEVLLGGVPLIDVAATENRWDGRARAELLDIRDAAGASQQVWLSGTAGRWTPHKSEIHEASGGLRWRVEHQDWRTLAGIPMPRQTRVTDGRRADMRIDYREQQVNPTLSRGAFATGAPPGVPVEESDCE